MEKSKFLLWSSILMIIYTVISVVSWVWQLSGRSLFPVSLIVLLVLSVICILIAYQKSSTKFAWAALAFTVLAGSTRFSWWSFVSLLTICLIYKGIKQLERGSHEQEVEEGFQSKVYKVKSFLVAAILSFLYALPAIAFILHDFLVGGHMLSWISVSTPLIFGVPVGILSLIAYRTNQKGWALGAAVLFGQFVPTLLFLAPLLFIHPMFALVIILVVVFPCIVIGLLIKGMMQLSKLERQPEEEILAETNEDEEQGDEVKDQMVIEVEDVGKSQVGFDQMSRKRRIVKVSLLSLVGIVILVGIFGWSNDESRLWGDDDDWEYDEEDYLSSLSSIDWELFSNGEYNIEYLDVETMDNRVYILYGYEDEGLRQVLTWLSDHQDLLNEGGGYFQIVIGFDNGEVMIFYADEPFEEVLSYMRREQ